MDGIKHKRLGGLYGSAERFFPVGQSFPFCPIFPIILRFSGSRTKRTVRCTRSNCARRRKEVSGLQAVRFFRLYWYSAKTNKHAREVIGCISVEALMTRSSKRRRLRSWRAASRSQTPPAGCAFRNRRSRTGCTPRTRATRTVLPQDARSAARRSSGATRSWMMLFVHSAARLPRRSAR